MADDLRLSVVIEALLNAKGFEDAKAALQGLADKTKEAAKSLDGIGKQDVSKREIRVFTDELLRSVGVMSEAGPAGRLAAEAFAAVGNAANLANVALAASGLLVVSLIPRLVEWFSDNEKVAKTQADVAGALGITKEKLDQILEKLPGLAGELAPLYDILASDRSEKLHKSLDETAQRVAEVRKAMAPLQAIVNDPNVTRFFHGQPQTVPIDPAKVEEARVKLEDLRLEEERLVKAGHQLEQTILDGSSAMERASSALDRKNEADRKAIENAREVNTFLEKIKKAQDGLNAAEAEGEQARRAIDAKTRKEMLDKDAAAIKEREDRARLGKLSPELLQKLAEVNIEQQAEAQFHEKKLKWNEEDAQLALKEYQDDKMYAAAKAGVMAQGLSAASDLFGKNKALAIAGAIADTWSSADKALAIYGPTPLGYAAMAGAIVQGMANVKNIESAKPGFDDPFADLTARKLGRRSAVDFVNNFAGEFVPGVIAGMGAAGSVNHHTTINRNINLGPVNGVIGSRTEFRKWLAREMTLAQRQEGRSTLGV